MDETIEITLLGQKRQLLLSFKAFIAMERHLRAEGLEPQEANPWSGEFWDNFSPTKMAVMIWACLRHEDKGLTPEGAVDLVPLSDLNRVQKALALAFQKAMGGSKKKKDPTRPT